MKITTALFGLTIILLIVIIVYVSVNNPPWAQKSYWMAHYVEKPWKIYQRSSGSFDDAAMLTLQRATSRPNPTPEEHALAATVITNNILAQEHRPQTVTPEAVERSQLRREMFDDARNHYMAALDGMHARQQQLQTNFIIDAAMGFAFEGLELLLTNDPIIAEFDWDFNNITQVHGIAIDQNLANVANQRLDELVNTRRAAAWSAVENQNGARGAGVATYINLATQNTDDPQNSHDTGVLSCLKAIVERLRSDQKNMILPSLDIIISEIQAKGPQLSENRAHRIADVLEVINQINNNERVISINATDSECLSRIWLRASDPKNIAVKNELYQAIFDALYDCWEEGVVGRKIVCVNGRTSRILSSLILLDWDKRNWEVKKLEQFKNDIYARAAEVIASEAEKASNSSDPNMQKAGRLHLAQTAEEMKSIGNVPKEASEKLANQMRNAIEVMVSDYVREVEEDLGVKGAIPSYMITTITEEAKAAVC